MEATRVFPLLVDPAPCPVCAAPHVRPLHVFAVNHGKRRITRQLNLALVGCPECGVVYSHPRPSEEDVRAYYASMDGWDERVDDDEATVEARLRRLASKHARHLELLRAHVALPETGRALDFGCGIGGWLEALAAEGWETYGLEPGPKAAAVAARRHTMLARVPREPNFDLIVVHHTLEHLRDPLATMRELAAASRPGAALWVSVPSLGSLGAHGDFDYVAGDKHLFSYTAASLRSLLARAGFEVLADSTGPAWAPAGRSPVPEKRLACVAARREAPPPTPPEPLEPALAALRDHGATRTQPATPPHSRLRRVAQRLLR